ncbi:MAG: D-alanine--D-alanine ligase [Oscillospiraceae bacterium]|nr:D-alanine--D-alanine ligase [Oscillospiraceae bacterium]
MSKTKVAVIFGGFSPEYTVSLKSAFSVINAIDKDKYEVTMIGITNKGLWYKYSGPIDNIPNDKWHGDEQHLTKVLLSADRGGGLLMFENDKVTSLPIDVVFPVMHGRYGEDGTVQGLCELSGIPVVGSGSAASSLCMDKIRSNNLVASVGITVPKFVSFEQIPTEAEILEATAILNLPVFVKPVKAGSSIGISKVEDYSQILVAVKDAFNYDNAVVIEEGVVGQEVGCSVIGNHDLRTGRVNEIEISQGFFDFTEKYSLITSKIHVPARIDTESEQRVQEAGKLIFRTLGCRGYARIDMFLKGDGDIVFIEANTIPGFTAHSQLPKMMKAAGVDYPELVDMLLELALQVERGQWYG